MSRLLTVIIFFLSTEASCQLHDSYSDSVRIKYLYDRAIDYEDLGQLDSALDCYLKILILAPTHASALQGAGSMFGDMKDYNKAFEYFSKSISEDRNNLLTLSNFCYYKGLAGNYQEAILYGDTALTIANDSIPIGAILNNRGYAHLKIGNIEQAFLDISRSINYLPHNPYAHRNMALIYIEEKKFNHACKAMNEAKRLGGITVVKEMMLKYCN